MYSIDLKEIKINDENYISNEFETLGQLFLAKKELLEDIKDLE